MTNGEVPKIGFTVGHGWKGGITSTPTVCKRKLVQKLKLPKSRGIATSSLLSSAQLIPISCSCCLWTLNSCSNQAINPFMWTMGRRSLSNSRYYTWFKQEIPRFSRAISERADWSRYLLNTTFSSLSRSISWFIPLIIDCADRSWSSTSFVSSRDFLSDSWSISIVLDAPSAV